jgi:hypothetical protein
MLSFTRRQLQESHHGNEGHSGILGHDGANGLLAAMGFSIKRKKGSHL